MQTAVRNAADTIIIITTTTTTIRSVRAAPLREELDDEQQRDFEFIRKQLEQYGYLRGNPTLHEFGDSLRNFQAVLGVEPTGELDKATIEAATRPRCAHADIRATPSGGRIKRFSLSKQAKWDRKHFTGHNELTLKWFISSYTHDIDRHIVKSVVRKAFNLWATQSNAKSSHKKIALKFVEAASKDDADINILWAEGAHGDNYDFDGANGSVGENNRNENVLAHTFFPGFDYPLNGDIHFDDAEVWVVDASTATEENGRRFFPYVLAHEIGHTLGLQHSLKSNALMYPYYKNVPLDKVQLDIDDQCSISMNYIGPSQYCIFVWVMTEVVEPHNLALTNKENYDNNSINNNNNNQQQKLLKGTRLPKCTSGPDKIRLMIEEKLAKQLHLSSIEVKRYTEASCNFLAGLHMYRASNGYSSSDSIEKEFNGVMHEVSSFAGTLSVRRMLRHVEQKTRELEIFDAKFFDKSFFDKFFSNYYSN
ncbi:unnamed protein product [Caenorhabditis bovis]|uniref:Peptidase metallopeptidase domain-containing protein n=1 Tax=Caenorhabditis bovis TaxID=2654633 RepID=A0A8S1ENG7_9PELO|nr:unnamed protein product [Caenorhabditis bovis]